MGDDLHAAILAAHGADNKRALVDLYSQAANQADTLDAACFFLTQAHVFALETNHPATPQIHAQLKSHGRV